MGIRIHKCIGYGLTDIKVEKYGIVDDRFNPIGYMMSDWEDRENTWTKEGWLTYYQNHSEMPWQISFYKDPKHSRWDFYDVITHDIEYGLPNVFLIIPPINNDWSRYDNIIDYVEEAIVNPRSTNRVKTMDSGIWPHSGLYTDLRTFTRANRLAHEFWFNLRSSKGELSKKRKQSHLNLASHYATSMGFESVIEAAANLPPEVPEEIQLMCRYLCLFNEEETIHQLRPLLYVYWA